MSDIQLQPFDHADPANIGRPYFFNVDQYLSSVEQMIIADEVDRALWMLDNMPGWYRDNVPELASVLRQQLLRKLYTTSDYIGAENAIEITRLIALEPTEINAHYMHALSRAKVTLSLCESLNSKGIAPHIVEVAPGQHWLPIGLKKNNIKFTYSDVSLDGSRNDQVKGYLGDIWQTSSDSPAQIFICFELIEHLRYPTEIYQHYLKANRLFTHILLSTPKYTVRSASPEWYNADLGHLRTYTPREFAQFSTTHWPEFKWAITLDEIMVLSGEKTPPAS